MTQDELVRMGRPLLRLRWWRNHHPRIVSLAERAGRSVEVPMETARHLVTSGAAVGFFTRTYIADDLARGKLTVIEVGRTAADVSR